MTIEDKKAVSVDVGPEKNQKKYWFPKISKKTLIILSSSLALLALIIAGVLGYFYYTNKDVVARVGSEKITTSDLNRAIFGFDFRGTPEKPESAGSEAVKKQVLDKLIEQSIIRQEAAKRDISVDEKLVQKDATETLSDIRLRPMEQQEAVRDASRAKLLEEALKEKILGYKEGDYLLIRFDKYLDKGPESPEFLAEKKQAQKYALELSARLNENKITMEAAKKELEAHPLFGTDAFAKVGYQVLITGALNKNVYDLDLGMLKDQDFRSLVNSTNEGSLSEPRTLSVAKQGEDFPSVEGIIAIVKINKVFGGEASNFTEWLDSKKAEYTKNNEPWSARVLKFFRIETANAVGSCTGGLVPTGSSSPAGLYVYLKYLSASGVQYDLSKSQASISTTSNATYTWSGVTRQCSTDDIVDTRGSSTSFPNGFTFTTNSSGNEYLGYKSCGGNGLALLCSCRSNYKVDPNAYSGDHGLTIPGGHWHGATFYKANGDTVSFTNEGGRSINPFEFSSIDNGATAGVKLTYQAEIPNTLSLVLAGGGTGQVTTTSLSCSKTTASNNTCSQNYLGSPNLTLTATASDGSTFSHFRTNGVNYTSSTQLSVLMNSSKTVEVWFNAPVAVTPSSTVNLSISPSGAGRVTASGGNFPFSNCQTSCTQSFVGTGTLSLSVGVPNSTSYEFSGWTVAGAPVGSEPFTRSVSAGSTLSVVANFREVILPMTCTVTPESGLAPLVVKVSVTGGKGPFSFNLGDSTILGNRNTPIYYTYAQSGTYDIVVSDSQSTPFTCSARATVSKPSSGSGGEVAP